LTTEHLLALLSVTSYWYIVTLNSGGASSTCRLVGVERGGISRWYRVSPLDEAIALLAALDDGPLLDVIRLAQKLNLVAISVMPD